MKYIVKLTAHEIELLKAALISKYEYAQSTDANISATIYRKLENAEKVK